MQHLHPVRHCLAAVVLVTALVTGCRASEPPRIGVVTTGDGPLAVRMAMEDVNATGGIDGKPLELRIVEEPHGLEAQKSIAIAESLAADPSVLAVIGHRGSGNSLAASQVYNTRRLVQIAPNSSAPLFSQAGPYSFRMVGSDLHQGAFIAERIVAMTPAPRIAIMYVNDDYGRALYDVVRRKLRAEGREIAYETPYLEGARFTNADDFARAIAGAKPNLFVWIGRSPELIQLLPKLRAALPDIRIIGSDGVGSAAINLQQLTLGDGDVVIGYVDPTAERPELRRVLDRFRERTGRPMNDGALFSYEAVWLLATAFREGVRDREAVRHYLEALGHERAPYEGIVGPLTFDVNGDPQGTYVALEIRGGAFRSLASR